MSRKSKTLALAAAGSLLLASAPLLAAGHEGPAKKAPWAAAKLSLSQAITIAEKEANGRAVEAEFESEHGAPVVEVEVLAADSVVFEVTVDAVSGKVLESERKGRDAKGDDDDDDDDDGDRDDNKSG